MEVENIRLRIYSRINTEYSNSYSIKTVYYMYSNTLRAATIMMTGFSSEHQTTPT